MVLSAIEKSVKWLLILRCQRMFIKENCEIYFPSLDKKKNVNNYLKVWLEEEEEKKRNRRGW